MSAVVLVVGCYARMSFYSELSCSICCRAYQLAACASWSSFYLNCHRAYQLAGWQLVLAALVSIRRLMATAKLISLLMCAVHSLNQLTVYDQLFATCRYCPASNLSWMMWFPEVICTCVA